MKSTSPESLAQTVWRIVRQIPPGQVATYGQIAVMLPPPEGSDPTEFRKLAPKWVGEAMNQVSSVDSKNIPWWRVVNAKGGISLPKGSAVALQQASRLKKEGVEFDAKEQIDLAKFGWAGPDVEWRLEHGLLPPPSPDEEDGAQQLNLL
jgi:methylated-DNA-protein-cysteine methyltransferase-like protein